MIVRKYKKIFVGGCESSGTTLLGSLLGSSDAGFTTPESDFLIKIIQQSNDKKKTYKSILENSFRFKLWKTSISYLNDEFKEETWDNLLTNYTKKNNQLNRDYVVDHTPSNIWYAKDLHDFFPGSKFINIVRDPRAVANSILPLDWGPNTCDEFSLWWLSRIGLSSSGASEIPQNDLIEVKYEDLITDPTTTLMNICNFCDIDYSDDMLLNDGFKTYSYTKKQHQLIGKPISSNNNEKWILNLSNTQIETIEFYCNTVMRKYGYKTITKYWSKKFSGYRFFVELCISRPYKNFLNIFRNYIRKKIVLR